MANIRLGNLLWKDNTLPNSVSNPVNTKDVNSDAIKNKVDTLATETKLEQVRTLLAGVATEDKLEQARALLQTISGKDFATQTTLAQVQSELALVKAELQEIKANQLSGDQKVQLSGTIVTNIIVNSAGPRLNPGEYIEYEVYAPAGTIYQIDDIQIMLGRNTPLNGAQSFSVYYADNIEPQIYFQSDAKNHIYYINGSLLWADTAEGRIKRPPVADSNFHFHPSVTSPLKGLRIGDQSSGVGIRVRFSNDSTEGQTNNFRRVIITMTEVG